jgi:hypothetical protein
MTVVTYLQDSVRYTIQYITSNITLFYYNHIYGLLQDTGRGNDDLSLSCFREN